MKKLLMIGMAIFCGILSSEKSNAQFTFGIKGGLNYSAMTVMNKQAFTDGSINKEGILGYNIGAFARIGKGIYVQPEVYLSSQGSKFIYNPDNGDTPEDVQSKLTVLNVPVLIGKSFGVGALNLRLNAGPVATIIMDKNVSFGEQFKQAYSDFSEYKNTTIGLQAGAGVDIANFTFDARYEAGLQKLNEKYGQRQNLFTLSVGLKLF